MTETYFVTGVLEVHRGLETRGIGETIKMFTALHRDKLLDANALD